MYEMKEEQPLPQDRVGGKKRERVSDQAACNARERKRTAAIKQSVEHLERVLKASGVQCASDRVSVIAAAAGHIQELQARVQQSEAALGAQPNPVPAQRRQKQRVSARPVSPGEDTSPADSGFPVCFNDTELADFSAGLTEEPPLEVSPLFSHAPVPMCAASLDGKFFACNRAFNQLSGFKDGELRAGVTMFDLFAGS